MADRIDLPVAPGQPYIEVEYDYEYKSKDRMITIKQGECFLLVKKTNGDWWQVRKEEGSKAFYVPAQYVREVRRALMPPTKPLLHTGGGVGSRGAFEKKLLTAVELRESNESLNKQCPAQAPGAGYLVALQPPTESKTSPKSPIRLQAPMDLDGEIAASEKSPREATEKNRSDLESGDELNNSLTEQLQGRPDSPFYTNHQDFKISPSSPPPLPSSSPLTTHAEWETYRDPNGRHFYYNRTTQERRWKPPRLRDSLGKRNEKHVTAPTETEESCLKQNVKDMWDFTLPGHQMATTQILPCEKSGPLNVTKITENGKKVRKNWTSSWTILQGSQLIFAKSQAMATSWFGSHQSKPEFSVDLKGASVEWASKEKSSKKHVLEVKTHRGPELLIQSDSESVINEWFKAINEAINIHAWESDEAIEEDMPESPGLEKTEKENQDQQKKTKTRLKKFLIRRPSLQAVRDKGYIKDVVFGCNLISLCQREKTTVPHFVKMCIEYIENDGLNLDGLYRVSGNLAVIQKLRFAVNHDEKINLADSKWEDIHVATGALKMFFRELPDPLFTYLHFNDFFNAIKIPDYKQKVQAIKDIVKQLPQPNQDTMQALFSHLRKVIEHGEQNRMTTQSVAIVFGPTLLRPEIENMHTAVHMVYQNQIVELILYEYDSIFHM